MASGCYSPIQFERMGNFAPECKAFVLSKRVSFSTITYGKSSIPNQELYSETFMEITSVGNLYSKLPAHV